MTEPLLFSPLQLRSLTLKNRIVVSPMCQYSAENGHLIDWHYQHHSRFALGGAGLAFVEATAVTRMGRITHGCTGIWDDAQIPAYSRITDMYKSHGCAVGIQIGHSGRRGSCARPWDGAASIPPDSPEPPWQIIGPSPIPELEGYPVPHQLSEAEIETLIEAFTAAAKRALTAGFDTIEVHGAHGYLLHSFFSPLSNHRTDAFGGSRENRMRLPLMVSKAVRDVWPDDRPVFYRASCVDNVDGGLQIEDTVALARELKRIGIDAIDCSSGGINGPSTLAGIHKGPGFQVPYSDEIRNNANITTIAVGLIVDPEHAEHILAQGKADMIALARELLSDPSWPYRAALKLGLENPHAVLPRNFRFFLERRTPIGSWK
jgi:2,4-dienoyl-CoA reductase-like NADH-dependent reductase (Old Yellow Enzyme family)